MQNQQRSQAGTPATNQGKPGTATPPPGNQPPQGGTSDGSPSSPPPRTKAEKLADLLRDDPAEGDGSPPPAGAGSEGEDGGSRKSKPQKFNDLAEIAGIEAAELYKLEIATAADGSPVTVEMLKDHHAKRSEFSVSQLQWEEERTRQNTELVRANADLRELLSAIPRDKLDPKVIEAVRGKVQANEKRERARTLEVIPDWRNTETMTKDLEGMGDWLKRYGYPAGYLKTVFDHRALLMMRDAWKREERVAKVLAEIEKEPPTATGKSKPGGAPPRKPGNGPQLKGRAGLEALLTD